MSPNCLWTIFALSLVVTAIWAMLVLGGLVYLVWELIQTAVTA